MDGQPLMQGGYGYPPQQQQMYGMPGGDPMMAIAGSHKLAIKQKASLMEAAGDALSGMIPCAEACCEKENIYEIFDEGTGQKVFHVKEESTFLCRCCCNPYHELKLHVYDPNTQQEVFVVDRPFKCGAQCPTWGPCCQQESTLYRGNNPEDTSAIVGMSKQPLCGGIFTPTVEVMMGVTDTAFAVVEGPLCCFGGLTEMCFDQPFPISRQSGKAEDVGKIVKEKPEGASAALKEIMTDADLFTLTFKDPSLQPPQKMMLLSTVLLLDYMFFEQNQPFECDGGSLTVVCCDCYMCGALQPCKCSCGGGEGEGE